MSLSYIKKKKKKKTLIQFRSLNKNTMYPLLTDRFQMILLLTQFLQSHYPFRSVIRVFHLPRVKQHVIVPWNVKVLQVLVAIGSWKDLLEPVQLRQLVLVHDQLSNVVRGQIFDNGLHVILTIPQIHIDRMLNPFLVIQPEFIQPVILAHHIQLILLR